MDKVNTWQLIKDRGFRQRSRESSPQHRRPNPLQTHIRRLKATRTQRASTISRHGSQQAELKTKHDVHDCDQEQQKKIKTSSAEE